MHLDNYDYSKVNYINCRIKIIIICKIHGEFKQSPNSHINKRGCPKCGIIEQTIKRSSNTQQFIEKSINVHDNKYDYSKINYINNKTKIIIICKIHGEFEQTPNNHNNGNGCLKCGIIEKAIKQSSNTQQFIEKSINVHDNKYDYSKVNYINDRTKIIIICKKHGDFLQIPNSHLNGSGCPFCVNKTEGILYEKLKNHYPSLTTQFSPKWIGNKRFDFCIPEHNIIIELDGMQHFKQISNWESPEIQQQNDKKKEKLANHHDYCIIRILQEDVLNDTDNSIIQLLETILTIINEKPTIQNIYIGEIYRQFT
jgi:very-short-patch-repair endonuclease